MNDDVVRAADRAPESVDDLTPEEITRLGRAMAHVLFVAWRATCAPPARPRAALYAKDERAS